MEKRQGKRWYHGHEKKGEYVSSHLHYNVTYLLEAEESDALRVRTDS